MITLNSLSPNQGARKDSKRVGRGCGSGLGKTAGRGMNGAGQRRGRKHKHYHEGGQNTLILRLPKRGFNPINRKVYQTVNLRQLEKFAQENDVVDSAYLLEKKLIKTSSENVKILADGQISKNITVKVQSFSAKAKEKIEAAGGKTEVVSVG